MIGMQKDKLDALILLAASELAAEETEDMQNVVYNIPVPAALDRKVSRLVRNWQREKKQKTVFVFLKRSCAAVLIVCTVLFTLAMRVDAVRAEFWRIITEWFDAYVEIDYQTELPLPTAIEVKKEPSWLPQKYKREVLADGIGSYVVLYKLNTGTEITYKQFLLSCDYSIDGEGAESSVVYVGDGKGIYLSFADKGYSILDWSDGQYHYSIISSGAIMDSNTLIRIAKSVK